MELTTARLLIRDAGDDDVEALAVIARSNPRFLETHEGPDALDRYDASAVGRDLAVAALDPARARGLHPRRRAGGGVG